jgi:hypothetical protein
MREQLDLDQRTRIPYMLDRAIRAGAMDCKCTECHSSDYLECDSEAMRGMNGWTVNLYCVNHPERVVALCEEHSLLLPMDQARDLGNRYLTHPEVRRGSHRGRGGKGGRSTHDRLVG